MVITRLAGAIALAAAVSGCNRTPAGPPPGQGMPPTPVVLSAARATPIEDASEYVASLKSLRSTTVQSQIDGQITKILVVAGDRVRQGAPLMQIDARRQQAAVSSQQAELTAAEATVSYARQQHQRNNELYAAGAISKQQLEQTETAQRTAEANLKALQAQVQQQEVQLRFFTITAPTAGVVGDVPIRVGSQVTPQTLLTTIDQNDTLEVNASVPIERAAALKLGLPLQVWSSDGAQRIATTSISFVSPHADDQTQSVLVKGNVKNPEATLRASQYVRARIVWKTADGLVVPVTAVLRVNGQFFAFVAEPAAGGALTAKQRPIKVGPIAGDNYPVLQGLKAGDRVVVSGAQKLADGAPIQDAPAGGSKPSAPGANPQSLIPSP
jgi:RND family efflux transporter MFP subunit